MQRQALVADLTDARRELYTVLRDVPAERWHRPLLVDAQANQVTLAEICGHISAWENRLLTIIHQVIQGDALHPDDRLILAQPGLLCQSGLPVVAQFNETARRRRSRWAWHDLMNELVWVREETGAALDGLDEEALAQTVSAVEIPNGQAKIVVATVFLRIASHDRYHTAVVRANLPRGTPQK